jgi:hypothetical protein
MSVRTCGSVEDELAGWYGIPYRFDHEQVLELRAEQ